MYDRQLAMLAPLAPDAVPQAYDLCGVHAARTQAPRGWTLDDRRSADEPSVTGPAPTSADLGGDRTVAVLAAALRAVPDPVSEDAIGPVAEVGRAHTRPALALRARAAGT